MDGWPKAKISLYSCEKQVKSILEVWFLQIPHTFENILYYLVSTDLRITVLRFIAFINTKYLVVNFSKRFFKNLLLNPCSHDHFLVLWVACHNKRAIPMTVEIFFSDDSSAWEEEEKRHQLPFFPQSIKEGLPICNVCVLVVVGL